MGVELDPLEVDLTVALDDLLGQLDVGLEQGLRGAGERGRGEPADVDEVVGDLGELVVEDSAHDVLRPAAVLLTAIGALWPTAVNADLPGGEHGAHGGRRPNHGRAVVHRTRTLGDVDPTVAAIFGGIAGLVIAALVWGALTWTDRELAAPPQPEPVLPSGVGDVLAVLRSSGIVVDPSDAVVNNSPAAVAHGLVRHGRLAHPALSELAHAVRGDGVIREVELELPRGGQRPGEQHGAGTFVHARVAPLGERHVLLLVEDMTQARRVEQVRRDFVGNVSHELKTPVGGLALLAEAVLDAADDPVAVRRFATRMQVEATRLTALVKEIVDLSRLQAAEVLTDPELVDIELVVDEALDHLRVTANAKEIVLADKCAEDLYVLGDRGLLVTAVRNLVGNAIAYSGSGTKVGVGARLVGDQVEIAVTDQGPGIPREEQERIFERFYRIDEARSRATGGTGLGLSIVKHICANHGGDVTVWSEEGHGSTFTIRLPAAPKSLASQRELYEREPAR